MTENKPTEKRSGIARVLSKLGYCSRAEGERLVAAGRVALNDVIVRDPETPTRLGIDRVSVDGAAVKAEQKVYWMLHKPPGIVTTADDEKGRDTIYTLLPAGTPWMGPVGRLDMQSEGLLLMTNDTEWANRITAPESHLEKTYQVQLGRAVDDTLLRRFVAGVEDDGEILKALRARVLQGNWIEIVLDEGKNRQIRRMADVCGLDVLRLVRVSIGRLQLGDLKAAGARSLTAEELALLT
jgi:23S rRNA pseudouridine2605 synthase